MEACKFIRPPAWQTGTFISAVCLRERLGKNWIGWGVSWQSEGIAFLCFASLFSLSSPFFSTLLKLQVKECLSPPSGSQRRLGKAGWIYGTTWNKSVHQENLITLSTMDFQVSFQEALWKLFSRRRLLEKKAFYYFKRLYGEEADAREVISESQMISIHSLTKIIPSSTSVFLFLCDDMNNKIYISLRKSRKKSVFKSPK